MYIYLYIYIYTYMYVYVYVYVYIYIRIYTYTYIHTLQGAIQTYASRCYTHMHTPLGVLLLGTRHIHIYIRKLLYT